MQHMAQVTIRTLQCLTFCFFVGEDSERSNQPEARVLFLFSSSTTVQYVIYTYMKHLGVRVKEPRSLESKRVRINFLPKIKVRTVNPRTSPLSRPYRVPDTCLVFHRQQKSIKTEKEGEEKVKKPRFPSILGPQRRPSRVEAPSGECRLDNQLNIYHHHHRATLTPSLPPLRSPRCQGVKPRTADLGPRNSCLSPRWGRATTQKLVVCEAANRVKALNSYTPCLSTPRPPAAPPTTPTQPGTLMLVSYPTASSNASVGDGGRGGF